MKDTFLMDFALGSISCFIIVYLLITGPMIYSVLVTGSKVFNAKEWYCREIKQEAWQCEKIKKEVKQNAMPKMQKQIYSY